MKQKKTDGFSIVELVLAIVVGAIFIGSMALIVNNYTDLSRRSRNLVLANSYAEGKVETLRNNGYNGINTGTSSLTSELPSDLASPKSASMTVTSPQDGLKKVVISINYSDLGISRTYIYTTYVGELGVGQ